jgi:hypothetical protein
MSKNIGEFWGPACWFGGTKPVPQPIRDMRKDIESYYRRVHGRAPTRKEMERRLANQADDGMAAVGVGACVPTPILHKDAAGAG